MKKLLIGITTTLMMIGSTSVFAQEISDLMEDNNQNITSNKIDIVELEYTVIEDDIYSDEDIKIEIIELENQLIDIDVSNINYLTDIDIEEQISIENDIYSDENIRIEIIDLDNQTLSRRNIINQSNIDYLTDIKDDNYLYQGTRASNNIWDWSKGNYVYYARINNSIETMYSFTGYSTYYIDVWEAFEFINDINQYQKSNVAYQIYVRNMKTDTKVGTINLTGTSSRSITVSGLDPSVAYSIGFVKDGRIMPYSELSIAGSIKTSKWYYSLFRCLKKLWIHLSGIVMRERQKFMGNETKNIDEFNRLIILNVSMVSTEAIILAVINVWIDIFIAEASLKITLFRTLLILAGSLFVYLVFNNYYRKKYNVTVPYIYKNNKKLIITFYIILMYQYTYLFFNNWI